MMASRLLAGGCHCGKLKVEFETGIDPADFSPRACDCSFCTKHGAAYISDPRAAFPSRWKAWTRSASIARARQAPGSWCAAAAGCWSPWSSVTASRVTAPSIRAAWKATWRSDRRKRFPRSDWPSKRSGAGGQRSGRPASNSRCPGTERARDPAGSDRAVAVWPRRFVAWLPRTASPHRPAAGARLAAMNERPAPIHLDSLDAAVDWLLARIDGPLHVGAPLGLGKPHRLLNALYARIENTTGRAPLHLYTALSLDPPGAGKGLEAPLPGAVRAAPFRRRLPAPGLRAGDEAQRAAGAYRGRGVLPAVGRAAELAARRSSATRASTTRTWRARWPTAGSTRSCRRWRAIRARPNARTRGCRCRATPT